MPENHQDKVQKQDKIKPVFLHHWRVFGFEIFLFAFSLALGILAALKLKTIFEAQKICPPPVSAGQFIIYFVLATLFLFLIIYFLRPKRVKGAIFKLLFILAIGFGNLYFFGLWLPPLLVFAWIVFLIVFLLKNPPVFLHNLALIFAIAGAGAGLGLQLQTQTVLLLLLVFSIYDFVAVYKTKHMVKFAEAMVEHKAIAGFVIPQKFSDLQTNVREIKPGGGFLILGGGDIIFPLIFVVSLLNQGAWDALIVALFSLVGLLFGFLIFISKKERTPMPALPPIALFTVLGYFLTIIL